jgi:hypothetical protein
MIFQWCTAALVMPKIRASSLCEPARVIALCLSIWQVYQNKHLTICIKTTLGKVLIKKSCCVFSLIYTYAMPQTSWGLFRKPYETLWN